MKTKAYQISMLARTMTEMAEKGTNTSSISTEIDKTYDELNGIKSEISKIQDVNVEVSNISVQRSDEFKVDLSSIGINENLVKNVVFGDNGDKKLELVLFEKLIDFKGATVSLYDAITSLTDNKLLFSFTISYMNESTKIVHTELYKGVSIVSISKSPLSLDSMEPVLLVVSVNYKELVHKYGK